MPPNNRERPPQNLTWQPPEKRAPMEPIPATDQPPEEKLTEFLRLPKVRLGPDGKGVDIARHYDQQRLIREQAAQAASPTPPEVPPVAPLAVPPPPVIQPPAMAFQPERIVRKTEPRKPVAEAIGTPSMRREEDLAEFARKEQADQRKTVEVIEAMNIYLEHAVRNPEKIREVLVKTAEQLSRHPEYARLLSVAPEAAKLYDDMQVALNGIYERNNGILQDPNFNAIDEFLRNGRAMLVPLAPEHPVLPPMSVPVSATEEPRTRAFHRNLVEEEEPLPGISVPINQPAPPATGWWDRIKKTLSRK